MVKTTFRADFRNAGWYCNLCYLANDEKGSLEEKETEFQSSANNCLLQIIRAYGEESKEGKMAGDALKRCADCGYRDPKIKDYLERVGIRMP